MPLWRDSPLSPYPGVSPRSGKGDARSSSNTPPKNTALKPGLTVAHGSDPNDLLDKGLAAVGGLELLVKKGALVTIKPNFSVPRTPDFAATTDARLVGGLVRRCLAAGTKEVRVATPQLIPRKGRCELCLLCQDVCPTGAIAHKPLDQIKMGTACIDHATCLAWGRGTLCLICAEQCPLQAISLDEKHRPLIAANVCVGCGACENGCPVDIPAVRVLPDS